MAVQISVSFITCVYNQDPVFFQECAESVRRQAGGRIEWIVVDDGSSPESARQHRRVVEEAQGDVPARYIGLPHNVGLSVARNLGFRAASGEWILVLDSDDRVSDDVTRILMEMPRSVSLTAFEARYFSGAHSEHRRLAIFEGLFRRYAGTSLDPFLWFDFYYHGIIARRDLLLKIGGYRAELQVGEDQDVLLRALEVISPDEVAFFSQIGYEYRENPGGVCKRRWKEVLRNYLATMLQGAKRRGGAFTGCRFGGVRSMGGGTIDCYEYRDRKNIWWGWEEWRRLTDASSEASN